MSTLVVDVSEHNGSFDWKKVKAEGVSGVIARTSDGDYKDKLYGPHRVRDIRGARLPFGVYHYGRVASPGNGQRSGAEEARMAVRFAKAHGWGRDTDLALAYDFEETNGQGAAKAAKHLIEFVKEYRRIEGHCPIIYTMPGLWRQVTPHLSSAELKLLDLCPLWEAHWGVSIPTPLTPWSPTAPELHQFADNYTLLRHKVDMSRANVPLSKLTRGYLTPKKVPSKPVKKPSGIPSWVPQKYWNYWRYPYQRAAARSSGFCSLLLAHGYLSPHFTVAEARSKDGVNVPGSLVKKCQQHAFKLEMLRHALGNIPMPITSWYRTVARNRAVGGAAGSKHIDAIATDHPREWVDAVGRNRVLNLANKLFANGGMGVYPGGAVHFDSRGYRARWSSWVPGR